MQGINSNHLVTPNNNHATTNTTINNSNFRSINNNDKKARAESLVDIPLRILVPTDLVGAIIGKGGQTIRHLTQQTRAKVDVYRGDPVSSTIQEKVITIRGQPENCVNACREIFKVMKADVESKGKPVSIPLKLLAHNDYIGRIIGKQGSIINTIKTETNTTVTVSNMNDSNFNVERVITVKGELENMIKALEIIYNKVKLAFENDTKTYGSHALMMNGLSSMPTIQQSLALPKAQLPIAPVNSSYVASQAPFNNRIASNYTDRYAFSQQYPIPNGGVHLSGPIIQYDTSHLPSVSTIANYTGYYPAPLYHHSQALMSSIPHNQPHNPHLLNGSSLIYNHVTNVTSKEAPNNNIAVYPSSNTSKSKSNHCNHESSSHSHDQNQNKAIVTNGKCNINDLPNGVANISLDGAASFSHVNREKVFLYIPNSAVGAIIGTKGSFIKNIIKSSGASVKITPLKTAPSQGEVKSNIERQVVIIGDSASQCKAQYFIYEKICQERFTTEDNVKLKVEVQVPSYLIGRVIGKAGKNVRELQRITGATIRLSDEAFQMQKELKSHQAKVNSGKEKLERDESSKEPSDDKSINEAATSEINISEQANHDAPSNDEKDKECETNEKEHTKEGLEPNYNISSCDDYVTLKILGTYNASQLAQRRIQTLILQGSTNMSPSKKSHLTGHDSAELKMKGNESTKEDSSLSFEAQKLVNGNAVTIEKDDASQDSEPEKTGKIEAEEKNTSETSSNSNNSSTSDKNAK